MDAEAIATFYNRCNPEEPLKPGDERNIDFDRMDSGARPRGEVWVSRIERRIARSSHKLCLLFSGLRGSGKTTELRRLTERLRNNFSGGKRYFPVRIDAADFVELTDEIEVADLLMGIVYHAERAVLKHEKKDPDDAGGEGVLARLWHWLRATKVEWNQQKLSVLGTNIPLEMKTDSSFRRTVRQAVNTHMTGFRKEVDSALERLVARVANKDTEWDDMVIILDSLEKLHGFSQNWEKVLNSAEHLFKGGAPYLRLPVHVIYTVPPALASRITDMEFLPMVKIRDHKRGDPYQPGIDAMRELVQKRIPDDSLRDLLGDRFEERIQEAIAWSAGYPRDLVRILYEICSEDLDDYPLNDGAWRRIRARFFDGYRRVVSDTEAYEWLARVYKHKDLSVEKPEQRQVADRMMSNNVVLYYQNDEFWYDLHPAARAIPGVQQAIARLDAERA